MPKWMFPAPGGLLVRKNPTARAVRQPHRTSQGKMRRSRLRRYRPPRITNRINGTMNPFPIDKTAAIVAAVMAIPVTMLPRLRYSDGMAAVRARTGIGQAI